VLNPGTLTAYSGGYLGPQGAPISVALTSASPTVGTISGSPASFGVYGSYYINSFLFQPVSAGTSNLSITEPAGYSTPSNEPLQITATVSAPTISVSNPIVGNNLETTVSISLAAAPPANETLTLTSSDSNHFLLSTSPTAVGLASITVPLTKGSGSVPTIYIQGENYTGSTAITATLTASAPGYTDGTGTETLYPSGVFIGTTNFGTTSFSSATNITVDLYVLNPGTLTAYSGGYLGPQGAPISVALTSASPTVGTISGSPASFTVYGNSYINSFLFQPVSAGTSNLSITEPAGYSAPSNEPLQITATVTAPTISVSNPIVGNNLETTVSVSLAAAPPANETLTLTSSDSNHFLLSTSPTAVGLASITVPLTKGSTSVPTIYIQGENYTGSTAITATLTASAPGYTNGTGTETLYPSGLFIGTTNFNTTSSSPATNITVDLYVLNPGSLTAYSGGYLGPQGAPISVALASASPTVGTISGSPASFGVYGSYYINSFLFQPVSAGTSNLSITEPAGYSTPSNEPLQITATVTQ
jgi:hypothetical protein